ncbi:uncharacterized protein LOC141908702 isoform X1 [Tubulanus polymorphus]|uniref:uncharacterized protein LOC141908702 isoform X1 n=2 Tax=Tubulanus polymorphus TaxID=672921 RepID=UPI003DA3FD57
MNASWGVILLLTVVATASVNSLGSSDVTGDDDFFDTNDIKKVHVVFMNHLDVGYSVPGGIGFAAQVVNEYFTNYFKLAMKLSEQLRTEGFVEHFIYTTHPWLVSFYLNCPPGLIWAGVLIKCPNATEISTFKAAVKRGDITWHAGPMNMQFENANELFVQFGLNMSKQLDEEFGIKRQIRVVSQRDVPGLTVGMVPNLVENGVQAISVGMNPGCPPTVFAGTSPFIWKYGDQEIIAAIHKGGYPQPAGKYPSQPGGISVKDCHYLKGFSEALCFAFRVDNTGPPVNVADVLHYYEILRAEFRQAKLVASTFDNFFEALLPFKSKLPVATQEIGDTWIQGIASDPKKLAEYRAVMRVLDNCINTGMCLSSDPIIRNAVRFLIKPGEHTYGLSSVADYKNYQNAAFEKVRTGVNYQHCQTAWYEQREMLYTGIKLLQGHPVYPSVVDELRRLDASLPDLTDYRRVSDISTFKCPSGLILGFNARDGSINRMLDPINKVNWASDEHKLMKFVYKTYNETDFVYMRAHYDLGTWDPGYGKPNSTLNAHPESRLWYSHVTDAYINIYEPCNVIIRSEMDLEWTYSYYGAPKAIWTRYNALKTGELEVEYIFEDKTPTRLAESLFVEVNPAPQTNHRWSITKLGSIIDPMNVMLNGSQLQHATDRGVAYTDTKQTGIYIETLDLSIVSPITTQQNATSIPAPLWPIKDLTGMAFNFYNNVWNTNYIFWYPYRYQDASFKARFLVSFRQPKSWPKRRRQSKPQSRKNHSDNNDSVLRWVSLKKAKSVVGA